MTKKLLVPHDALQPDAAPEDFLIVEMIDDRPALVETQTGKQCEAGRVVFVGQEVTMNDLFARRVESRRPIDNVKRTLSVLSSFVDQVAELPLGGIVTIAPEGHDGFRLVLEPESNTAVTRLP